MVYLHSFLKSKPAARPWQDWCIWRERVVGSRLQLTLGSRERVFADSIHVCVQCKGRLGKFEQQGLIVKCRFYFVLCFFCSSELPSRLSPVAKLWVFPSMCSEKCGCRLPFQQSNPVWWISVIHCQWHQTVQRRFWLVQTMMCHEQGILEEDTSEGGFVTI